MADDRPLVGQVEIDDEVLGGDDFKKGDPPFGIGLVVEDHSPCPDLFLGRGEGSLSKSENIVDGPIRPLAVSFDGIDAVLFGEVRNIGDHPPVAHIAVEIDFLDSMKGNFWVIDHGLGGARRDGVGIDGKNGGRKHAEKGEEFKRVGEGKHWRR